MDELIEAGYGEGVFGWPYRMALAVLLSGIVGCSRAAATKSRDGEETLSLRYEGSAGVVSPPELADDLGYLAPFKLEYVGNNASGGPHSIQAVVSGDIDFGASFNGSIVKLVASKAPLRAVVAAYGTDRETYQGFYVLDGSAIRGPRDFAGKKVALNTLGAHAEYVLREYLHRGGLNGEQAKQVAMIPLPAINAELALREKQVDVAMLGNIFRERALARGGLREVASDYQLFGEFDAGSYVMSTRFLAAHPNAARKFAEAVGRALDWTRARPRAEVRARFEAIIRRRKRNEDASVVQHWRGWGVGAKRGLLADRDFQIWIDWLVRDGQLPGGRVQARDVYTNAFQPASLD